MWIDNIFPNITSSKYNITSNASVKYNCIAWAAGDTTAWWADCPGYRWPNAPRNPTVESLITVFIEMGYQICDNDNLESGFDKVAIYEKNGMWTHAARQLSTGRWTSKLGKDEDIEHSTPEDLTGNIYGRVHTIMKRERNYGSKETQSS